MNLHDEATLIVDEPIIEALAGESDAIAERLLACLSDIRSSVREVMCAFLQSLSAFRLSLAARALPSILRHFVV